MFALLVVVVRSGFLAARLLRSIVIVFMLEESLHAEPDNYSMIHRYGEERLQFGYRFRGFEKAPFTRRRVRKELQIRVLKPDQRNGRRMFPRVDIGIVQ